MDRLKPIIGGCSMPPNFVDGSQTSKFTKVFSLESFLLYGMGKHVACTMVISYGYNYSLL